MNAKKLLSIIIVIIIIIGGVIIVIIGGKQPFPEPECLVCGLNLVKLLGIAEVLLGLSALGVMGRLVDKQQGFKN